MFGRHLLDGSRVDVMASTASSCARSPRPVLRHNFGMQGYSWVLARRFWRRIRPVLARNQMKRGAPRADLPPGIRHDARKHTRHVLAPTKELVEAYLSDPSDLAWQAFRQGYLAILRRRFEADRHRFDDLADLARETDVFIGCSCPTKKNPNVRHCHTWLALEFMREKYPELDVVFPDSG